MADTPEVDSQTSAAAADARGTTEEAHVNDVADADPKFLLREYEAVHVYEAAVEAAAAVLPRRLASAFLAELIRRLS
jgi:hypothetical protein